MHIPRLITRVDLAELLKIGKTTLGMWQAQGWLKATIVNRICHYDEEGINKLLASCEHTFPKPPTLDDLLSGRLVLLDGAEVMTRLNLSGHTSVQYKLHMGELMGIKFGNRWRYSKASVDATLLNKDSVENPFKSGVLSRNLTAHVLGVPVKAIADLVYAGRLQSTKNRPVALNSLLRLLKELLPNWIEPHDWLHDRLTDDRPLLYTTTVCAQLGLKRRELMRLLDGRYLDYICIARGKKWTLISPSSIDLYPYSNTPHAFEQIAWLFGVDEQTVHEWITDGLLFCPIETHDHSVNPAHFYRSCLLAILRMRLSPSALAMAWYRKHMLCEDKLLPWYQAADMLHIPRNVAFDLMATGTIHRIETPAGVWMIAPQQLENATQNSGDEPILTMACPGILFVKFSS